MQTVNSGRMKGRNILLVVTGGIAAYKAALLVRGLTRTGAEVQVLMTPAATQFVTPLTFATLSGRPVLDRLFPDPPPSSPIHLQAAEWGEVLVVAPASAGFIAKMACGIADDLPSSVVPAFQGDVLVAPAMNPRMWRNEAVQDNVERLKARGVQFIGPDTGEMGGLREPPGTGRMARPEAILDRIAVLLASDDNWRGRKVIVTSGPTREPIDPVRFIGNRSSGRMGDAVAAEAHLRGAEVTLVRGLGAAGDPPLGVETVPVETAAEMAEAVKAVFDSCDLLVMAAAVADWRTANPAGRKLKRSEGPPRIEWTLSEDILAWAGHNRTRQAVVGFALETERHLEGASGKLQEKKIYCAFYKIIFMKVYSLRRTPLDPSILHLN
mgnify:CR=1 FL=1